MKINSKFIVICGILDLFLIGWIFANDFLNQKIPIYTNMLIGMKSANEFELNSGLLSALSVLSAILVISVIVSGYLMLRSKKLGVYISFFQAPFRFFLLIQPSFFFIMSLGSYFGISHAISLVFVFALELLKISGQILWVKKSRESGLKFDKE